MVKAAVHNFFLFKLLAALFQFGEGTKSSNKWYKCNGASVSAQSNTM